MNADHQDSLVRYLEHYCQLSSYSASHAQMRDIRFDSMTISSGPQHHQIAIQPPLTAWAEVRPRVVAMDAEALKGLDRSSITVKRYDKPYGFMAAIMVACICTYIAFSRRANFEKGSLLYTLLLGYVPTFSNFCWTIQPWVIYPMVIIHVAEMVYFSRGRLRRYNVPRFSVVWWKWVASNFLEGSGAFIRFDGVVQEEERRRTNARH